MADHAMSVPTSRDDTEPKIRRITLGDVREALRRGYEDFLAMPSHALFLVIIYPVIGLLLGFTTANADLVPLFFPLAAGFALLGPVAAIGLYEMSRRRERNQEVSASHALAVTRSPAFPAVIELASLLAVLFVAWLIAAMVIFRVTIGSAPTGGLFAFIGDVLSTPAGWALIVIGNAVGFAFALAAFALGAVSFPMLLDRNVGLRTAVSTSVRAIRANPGPMAAWGLTIAVLMALGSLPFFIGLAVVLPVLGHATWHMYRALVV
jgi:uncharacterized membrane protein